MSNKRKPKKNGERRKSILNKNMGAISRANHRSIPLVFRYLPSKRSFKTDYSSVIFLKRRTVFNNMGESASYIYIIIVIFFQNNFFMVRDVCLIMFSNIFNVMCYLSFYRMKNYLKILLDCHSYVIP